MKNHAKKLFSRLSLLALMALYECAIDCNADRNNAGALSVECCQLTRPSIEPSYKECKDRMLESFRKKTNLTKTEDLALKICTEECVFIDNGYIDSEPPYLLDYERLTGNLNKIMPEPQNIAISFMQEAYTKCAAFRQGHPKKIDIKFPDISITDTVCTPYAMQITVCVRIFAMQDCPEAFQVQSSECVQARNYFKECLLDLKKLQVAAKS